MNIRFSTKLIFAFVLAGISPILLAAIFYNFYVKFYLKGFAVDIIDRFSQKLALEFHSNVSDTIDSARIISENPIVRSKESSIEEKTKSLNEAIKSSPLLNSIEILSPEGDILTAASSSNFTRWRANYWFNTSIREHKIIVSDFYMADETSNPIYSIFVPIFDDKQDIIYVLVVNSNLKNIRKIISFKPINDSITLIVNSRGEIVASTIEGNYFKNTRDEYSVDITGESRNGKTEFFYNGKNYIASYYTIGDFGNGGNSQWRILFAVPESEVLRIYSQTIVFFIFCVVLFIPIVLIISLRLAKSISKPIHGLIDASEKISEGNFEIKLPSRNDEFHELNMAFNTMASNLKNSYEELRHAREYSEIEVEKRNKKLIEAVSKLESKLKKKTSSLEKQFAKLKDTKEKLEQERDKIKSVLQNIRAGIIIINRDQQIELINDLAKNVLELKNTPCEGKKLSDLIINRNVQTLLQALSTSNKLAVREIVLNNDSKIIFEVAQYDVPGQDETIITLNDITQYKRNEKS